MEGGNFLGVEGQKEFAPEEMEHIQVCSQDSTQKHFRYLLQIPEDLTSGKDRIIFGNVRAIYDLHKKLVR